MAQRSICPFPEHETTEIPKVLDGTDLSCKMCPGMNRVSVVLDSLCLAGKKIE